MPEVTHAIESEIAAFDVSPQTPTRNKAESQTIDPRRIYLSRLREIVDLDTLKKTGIKIVFNPMWGSARGYSDALLREAGVDVATVHDTRDVLFGGHAPEPDDHLSGRLARQDARNRRCHWHCDRR
jgi:phosphomannomutase